MRSKKDQQRQIREAKQAQSKLKQKYTGIAVKIAAVILVPLIAVVLYQGLRTSAAVMSPAEVASSDHVRGEATAPVTLTIYGDFQCPACLEEAQYLGRAWPQIADKTRLVFRHYPLDTHRHAFLAARYAEAAALQDKFWEMHDVLYANQGLWSNVTDAAILFNGYAEELELDIEKLLTDIEDPEVRNKILADQRGGVRAGVRATPSIFVNGRPVSNPRSASEFVSLVNRAANAQ